MNPWLDRVLYAAFVTAIVLTMLAVSAPAWRHYRVSIYAVPTCQPAAPIPAHAMTVNPFQGVNDE